MKKIIITGGAGFIGSALIAELNKRGCDDLLVVDDVDHEREKLSAGSGKARSAAGSTSLRPRSGARPYFG